MEKGSEDYKLPYQLLVGLADHLKLPLLQINNLSSENSQSTESLKTINSVSGASLKLIENYILGLRIRQRELEIINEPLSLSSVMYESAKLLENFAKQYHVNLDVSINPNLGPVIANKSAIEGVIVSVGEALIESVSSSNIKNITLATHKCRYGVVAGVYANGLEVTPAMLRQGRNLVGNSRRPMPQLSHSNVSGIFIADQLLKSMNMHLLISKHKNLKGFGAIMNSSTQMQLV